MFVMNRGRAHLKRDPWPPVPLGAMLLLSGCFFDQLQRAEESDIQRVEQKQASAQAAKFRSATLEQEEEQLAAELSERQFSLNALNDRVQEINADNGRTIAQNDAARFRYHDLLAQLQETNEQLALAQQGTVGSIEEQRERIASLKARIKAQIHLLLR
jgi:predicted  nucleic acid-binding Zn-ribbon protein